MIELLETYLKIVLISKEEADYIDYGLGFKTSMPLGWKWGDDSMQRLKSGNIELAE